jgi:hypothetical protein
MQVYATMKVDSGRGQSVRRHTKPGRTGEKGKILTKRGDIHGLEQHRYDP